MHKHIPYIIVLVSLLYLGGCSSADDEAVELDFGYDYYSSASTDNIDNIALITCTRLILGNVLY